MMKLWKWAKSNFKDVIIFVGPILFEIVNEITGNWTNADGKISIGIGKFITILIGVAYFGIVGYLTYKEYTEANKLRELEEKNKELEKKNKTYISIDKSVCDILGYTTEKTKEQIADFKRNLRVDTSHINATSAATIVCERIYSSISELIDEPKDVTVNYYRKYQDENGNIVSEMIAHEGYNTTPKFFRIPRLLKIDRKSYYCERILDNSNPDVVFLKNKEEVARAFGIHEISSCKYNQYIAIPIRRFASNDKVALIEIVAHNDSVLWNDIEEVRKFVECYCEVFMEYTLLIDMLSNLYGTINKYQIGEKWGKENGENCEISQER